MRMIKKENIISQRIKLIYITVYTIICQGDPTQTR